MPDVELGAQDIAAEEGRLLCYTRYHTVYCTMDRELLKGSIALLILTLLGEREMYGYEIIQEAARRSRDAFQFKEGTLYPALHALEQRGLLRSEWRVAENGRERKYYGLTPAGRRAAQSSTKDWQTFVAAVNAVLTNP